MKHLLLFISILFLFVSQLLATHNRAGEITYKQDNLNPLKYVITIITYTDPSVAADRPTLPMSWGDGDFDTLQRTNGPPQNGIPYGELITPKIKMNIYIGTHIYPGAGTYFISFEDPNRNAGIMNITNSVQVPFYVETMIIINPFIGSNSSPILYLPPIDEGCVGKLFIHNPNAFDPDGDSLSYKLVASKGQGGVNIPTYSLPTASDTLYLNSLTGDFVWDSPTMVGEFNIAIIIEEWRDGLRIGYITRDMQITVLPSCSHSAPLITTLTDTCVEAGTTLSFNVTAADPNPNDLLTLSATGAPLSYFANNPATFTPVTQVGSVTGTFTWNTLCLHVRKSPYQVIFKVADNGGSFGGSNLFDLHITKILVVGPSPKNPMASPMGSKILLSWDESVCNGVNEVVRYDIYRRSGFINFIPSFCELGVPAYTGYTKIGSVADVTTTSFLDDNNGASLSPGIEYCYMIVAVFNDGAESYASVEVCAELKKDIPVITNVSIESTDVSTGEVYVAWSKPSELDTVMIPGPYTYVLYRSPDFFGSSFTQVATFNNINDTTFTDSGLDTRTHPWSYKIEFYSDNNLLGQTQVASSVFLSIFATDNRNILSWEEHVPWINNHNTLNQYRIFRKEPGGSVFTQIALSNTNTYTDEGLENGEEYCYYIRSSGHYTVPGFVDPIINFSQENCAIPVDNEPPCKPQFNVLSDCDRNENTLVWAKPTVAPCPDDILHYNIYFKEFLNDDLQLIATISSSDDTIKFLHTGSVIGCYSVTAVDSLLNESAIGEPICIGTGDFPCDPQYNLPNVFSPNGDGLNDIFHPCDHTTGAMQQLTCKPYRFVKDVHITFYNRWGAKVFESNDIDINWDGRNNDGGELSSGTYFYIAEVDFIKLTGLERRVLQGFVKLIR